MFRNTLLVFILPVIIILGAGLGSIALVISAPVVPQTQQASPPASVRVLSVQPRSLRLRVPSQGVVEPLILADLIPEVSGKITWISPALVPGGSFEAGEVLLRIDEEDYRSTVRRRQAALSRAAAEEELAHQEFGRQQELVNKKLTSESILDNALRVHRIAEANLTDARLALNEALRALKRTRLEAPFAGLVGRETVDLGQFVSRGQKVAQLYGRQFVEVRLPLADRQLAYLDIPPGASGELPVAGRPKVTLSAHFAGREHRWQGEIVRMEAELDAHTRMAHLVARVGNDLQDSLPVPIGLFVKADIEGREVGNLVVLPRAALRDNEQVLVVDEENRLQHRQVSLFRFEQEEVLIDAGLEEGELVCVSPLRTVVAGMPVLPVPDDLTRS